MPLLELPGGQRSRDAAVQRFIADYPSPQAEWRAQHPEIPDAAYLATNRFLIGRRYVRFGEVVNDISRQRQLNGGIGID